MKKSAFPIFIHNTIGILDKIHRQSWEILELQTLQSR